MYTTIAPNQLHCDLEPEVLDVLDGTVWVETLLQNVRVSNCHIKQELKDVLVKLSSLCPAAVIPTQLITSVDATHALIIQNDGFRTRDGCM